MYYNFLFTCKLPFIFMNSHVDVIRIGTEKSFWAMILLPPATKLRQGNAFTPVCHSVHRGLCPSMHHRSHDQGEGVSVQGVSVRGSLSRGVSIEWAVRILLKCILVLWVHYSGTRDVILCFTRMHSSRMHTIRSSSHISGGEPGLGGVPAPRGVNLVWEGTCSQGGVPGPKGWCTWPWGVYLVPGWGCTWSRGCTWSGGCTWSQGGVPGLGVYLVWGVSAWGCIWPRGCTLCQGVVYLVRYSPPVDRQMPVKT